MKHPTPKINEKLIRRAALKYREWMITKSKDPKTDHQYWVDTRLDRLAAKTNAIRRLCEQFFTMRGERIQTNPYGNQRPFKCIANPRTHDHIVTKMIPCLGDDIISEAKLTITTLKNIVETNIECPSQIKIVEEIKIVASRWETKFREGTLSVFIPDVTVKDKYEEVYLGSFWINLDLNDPLSKTIIRSVDKIASEGGYYHPHVNKQVLCVGEGVDATKAAICRGDLEYYFDTLESVLRTYNSGSFHEELSQWYEPNTEDKSYCESCDEWVDNDYVSYCDRCNMTRCQGCDDGNGSCESCSYYVCGDCCTSCEGCGNIVCDNCHIICEQCNNKYCIECVGSCVKCEDLYCNECSTNCFVCSDRLCEDCLVPCDCCTNECCSNCLNGHCEHCNKDICSECTTYCDDCEVPMCSDCDDEHSCILAEVSN